MYVLYVYTAYSVQCQYTIYLESTAVLYQQYGHLLISQAILQYRCNSTFISTAVFEQYNTILKSEFLLCVLYTGGRKNTVVVYCIRSTNAVL